MSHLNINGVDKPLDHIRLNNVRSDNLFDGTLLIGYYYDSIDNLQYSQNFRSFRIQSLSAGQYTISWNIPVKLVRAYYNGTMHIDVGDNLTSYTVTSSDGDIAFSFRDATSAQTPWSNSNTVMLNTGSTALPYQPYLITKEAWEARTRVILHNLTNPLCGIRTYKDTLDLSTGTLTRYIKKMVLTGNENWKQHGTIANMFYVDNIITDSMADNDSDGFMISNRFKQRKYKEVVSIASGQFVYGLTGGVKRLLIKLSDCVDADAFKTWLTTHQTIIYYVLVTVETEQITVPSNLTGIVEGYLTQSSTPTPTSPVYPTANGTPEQGDTYSLDIGAYAITWGRADTFTGTNPMSARCYGLPIKSWEIDGNSQQNGTPTPDNIIMPTFCGERTENLFDAKWFIDTAIPVNGTVSLSGNTIILSPIEQDAYVNRVYSRTQSVPPDERKCCIPVLPETEYTIIMENARKSYVSFIGSDYSCVYGYSQIPKTTPQEPFTFTTPSDCTYIVIRLGQWVASTSTQIEFPNIMLVKGSEAPSAYEPYGYAIQIYSYTQNTVSGQTPLTLTDSVGHNLISWDGEGATTSSGTPAPTSPVTVSGWGNKTENLYNSSEVSWELGILDDNGNPTGATTSHYTKNFTAVEPETAYYLSGTIYIGQSGHRIYHYDANKNWISRSSLLGYNDGNFTTPANCKYVRFQIIVDLESTSDWMLNLGSTPLTYEPYGYKIPITSAGQTQNVYLGQIQTTRKIKKLVLTGEEGWEMSATTTGGFYLASVSDYLRSIGNVTSVCTHYPASVQTVGMSTVPNKTTSFYGTSQYDRLYINDSSFASKDAFKSYLAQQYTSGTPVTVWYILAEPETGIVNEPLMKIGDYADSITSTQARVTIPTAKGNATLTTNNTVQPSIIHATYDKYISGGDVSVYLGQVQTTRKIKKLVFDGTENFNYSEQYLRFSVPIDGIKNGRTRIMRSFCSHYECLYHDEPYDNEWDNVYYQAEDRLYFHDRRFGTVVGFKQWLADQYAAGTPVTVWYILANEETSIVNEPLAKIGEYADTLTSEQAGITIPTTDGNNTISVDTSLAPSKMTITGHIRDVWFKQSITGVSPLSFKSNGTPLISLSMKGNGQQNGTPTPDNPVYPEFVGERTENLFDYSTVTIGKYIAANGNEVSSTGTGEQILNHSDYIKVNAGTTYTFKCTKATDQTSTFNAFCWFDSSKQLISRDVFDVGSASDTVLITATAPTGTAYLIMNYRGLHGDTAMLNTGSTILPYEPYGWAEKITNAVQTVPIYLGQVSTLRRVKKLVLTGQETWTLQKSGTTSAYFSATDVADLAVQMQLLCTHYQAGEVYTSNTDTGILVLANGGVRIREENAASSDLSTFVAFLQQQYAAGTPITVWYVLATPTTGIVNEPLCKIGDYADELNSTDAGVSIPTANGENTLTVDTTLSPSSVSITGYIKAIDQ